MKKLTFLVVALAFSLSLQAQTRVVGFDGFAGSNPPNPDPANPLTTGAGIVLTLTQAQDDGGNVIVTDPAGSPLSDLGITAVTNGTPYMGLALTAGDTFRFTQPGGTFTMVSIDLSKLTANDAGSLPMGFSNANSLTFVGTLASGGTVSTSVPLTTSFQTYNFPSEWTNLTAVTLTKGSSTAQFGLFGMDNITYVPRCNVTFTQSGFTIGGLSAFINGQTYNIGVGAANGCAWSISGLPSWATSSNGATSVGPGQMNLQVQANTGAERSANITVGGSTFVLEQPSGLGNPGVRGRIAHVTSAGTWKFTLVEANLGASQAFGRLGFSTEAGIGLNLPWTFPQATSPSPLATNPLLAFTIDRRLNPNAHIVMESTGPDASPAAIGSGNLFVGTGDQITAFGIFSNATFHWDAVVPLETRNANSYYLAFDNTGNLATGVAVSGFGAIVVTLRDENGAVIGNDTITLPNNGHISFMLNQRYASTVGKRGSVQFDKPSGGQVTVLGLRANGPALTSLPVLANVTAAGGSISHVTYNGGFTSVFYMMNTGSASASFTLNFYNETTGAPLSVPLRLPATGVTQTTSTFTQTLAPGAVIAIETVAQDAQPGISGSAVLTTTGNVSGFEIFRWTTFGQEASVPVETRSPGSYVLIFDNTGGLTTGVAVSSNTAANVSVIIRDDAGTQIGSGTISLAAHGHTSFLLPDKYAFAANRRGMIEFVVPQGGNIAVVGLRAKSDGTLTTIPPLDKTVAP
ncbi:MAG: hypothetical protein ABL995_03525 [Bryobacteraceae bacterium]